MCEIAVVPGAPAEDNAENYVDLAATLYQQNSHGLGIIAVYDESAGREDKFGFSYYKTTDPTERWEQIYQWLQERSDAWRFVFHARLATAGGKSVEATHPLVMEDDDIDPELVVHNGQVYGHRRKRSNLKQDDHVFATEVDSEVIAHVHDEVPDTLDEFEGTQLRGNLNYLLFNEDGILIRNSGKYTLADDMTMSCRPTTAQTAAESQLPVGDDDVDGLGQCFALFKPDGSYERMDASRKAYTTGTAGKVPSRGRRSGAYWSGYGSSFDDDDDGNGQSGRTGRRQEGNGRTADTTGDGDRDGADKATYIDGQGVRQVKEEAVVEYADTSRQDELDRFAVTDDGLFSVTVLDSVIKDDHFTVTVKDDAENAVQGARIFVRCPADDMSYRERGVYTTDETGAVMLPKPKQVILVTARMVTVPEDAFPEGALPDDDDDGDSSDGDDDRVLSHREARNVDWWYHYTQYDAPSDKDGFCSLCMTEFVGDSCQMCLDRHDKSDLLEKSQDELEEDIYELDDETEHIPMAHETRYEE